MKILVLTLFMLITMTVTAIAYTLSWTASENAIETTGYRVYYCQVDSTDIEMIDRGTALNLDLDNIELLIGTRYEFWCTAYNDSAESPESDHIRWTMPPSEPVIIEMAGAPVQIIINP